MDQKKAADREEIKTIVYNNAQPIQEEAMAQAQDTIPKRFREICTRYPENPALLSKNGESVFKTITYAELYGMVTRFAAVLVDLGITRGDHIGIISDNRKEWLITDLALLSIGAIDVPRGSDSTSEEIGYILGHADCPLSFAENANQLEKIVSQVSRLPALKRVIVFDDSFSLDPLRSYPFQIMKFSDVFGEAHGMSRQRIEEIERTIDAGNTDDWATIIYTSGTTGEPKGVILTHRAFLFQVDRILNRIPLKPGHVFISVLPYGTPSSAPWNTSLSSTQPPSRIRNP
jgi:long-chain acyl-CoA synthetase